MKTAPEKQRLLRQKTTLTSRWIALATPLILAVIIHLFWSPALKNGSLNFDDTKTTFQNENVKSFKTLNWESIKKLNEPTDNLQVWVTQYTHALDWQRYGNDARGHHLTSLLIFELTLVIIFFFVFLLSGKNIYLSIAVVVLFGLNPVQVESIAWISARKDQMMGLMVFSSLLSYLTLVKRIQKTNGYKKFFVGLMIQIIPTTFFVLAIFSKGMAVTLPFALVLIDWFLDRKWNWVEKINLPKSLKFLIPSILEKIPFGILMIVFGLQNVHAQNMGGYHVSLLNFDILRGNYGLIIQTIKLLFPFHGWLCAHIPLGYEKSTAILCSLIVLAWIYSIWHLRKNKVYVFGNLFYFIFIGIVQYVPAGNNIIMAERYLYVGSFGIFMIIAYFITKTLSEKTKNIRRVIVGICFGYVGFLAYNLEERIPVWKNSETLWSDVLKKYPENFTALRGIVQYKMFEERNYLFVIQIIQEKINLLDSESSGMDEVIILCLAGNASLRLGLPEKAQYFYQKTLKAKNFSATSAVEINRYLESMEDYADIIESTGDFLTARKIRSYAISQSNELTVNDNNEYHYLYLPTIGILHAKNNELTLARNVFRKYLEIEPNEKKAMFLNIANTYDLENLTDSALFYSKKVIELFPLDTEGYILTSEIFLHRGILDSSHIYLNKKP